MGGFSLLAPLSSTYDSASSFKYRLCSIKREGLGAGLKVGPLQSGSLGSLLVRQVLSSAN